MEVIGTLLKQKVTGDVRRDWEEIHVPRKEYLSSKQASHVYTLLTEDVKGGQQVHLSPKTLTPTLCSCPSRWQRKRIQNTSNVLLHNTFRFA